MEKQQQPEALILANDRPSAIGDDLYQWALDAEDMIRRLHTRVEELEKDRGNAKRLASKIWDKHPEARGTIEEGTGAWLVFGQDVETSGVSAQRVTQTADHIAQPLEMVSAPVVLPDGWTIVPVEPTPPMVEAGATERTTPHITAGHGAIAAFKAMLEHAPEYPALASTTAAAPGVPNLDAVNLDRLGKALTKLGHATWVSQEEAAAEIPRWVNALTSCVLEIPEAAPKPQADALDATQILIRPAVAQKIPRDPIPTVDTWETCTIKEAKGLNPALWRVRMLYPQEAIDAAIAAAKESR